MEGERRLIRLADGRDIEYLTAGLPLVVHEGTPIGLVLNSKVGEAAILAAHIPGARAHLEPGAGHLTITVTAIGRILDDLLDLAGRRLASENSAGAAARRPRRATSIGIVSAPSSPEPAGPNRDLPSADADSPLAPAPAQVPVPGGTPTSVEADFPDAGAPDAFQRLWTPHRMAYIKGEGKPTGPGADEGCPFCIAPTLSDEEGLIVARGQLVYAIMNLYPYNSGHVLIIPYRHVADYTELTREESAEFGDYTTKAITALRTASGPHGFNIGMNLGTVAGAGIAAHLHQHVVPRWGGDTNFMPVVGQTRVLPQLLVDTRKLLADAWPGA